MNAIGGRFHAVTDPRRPARHLFSTVLALIGTPADRLRKAKMRRRLTRMRSPEILNAPDIPTPEFLS
jgi:hypothetical protein